MLNLFIFNPNFLLLFQMTCGLHVCFLVTMQCGGGFFSLLRDFSIGVLKFLI